MRLHVHPTHRSRNSHTPRTHVCTCTLRTSKLWEIWFVAAYNMGIIVVFLMVLMELAQWVINGNATSHIDDLIRDWDAYKLHLLMEEQQLEATAYARDEEEKEREDQVGQPSKQMQCTPFPPTLTHPPL